MEFQTAWGQAKGTCFIENAALKFQAISIKKEIAVYDKAREKKSNKLSVHCPLALNTLSEYFLNNKIALLKTVSPVLIQ